MSTSNTERRTWEQFRATGMLFMVNMFLHVLGWAIVVEVDDITDQIVRVYPARLKWRGFSEDEQRRAFRKIEDYLRKEAERINDGGKP